MDISNHFGKEYLREHLTEVVGRPGEEISYPTKLGFCGFASVVAF